MMKCTVTKRRCHQGVALLWVLLSTASNIDAFHMSNSRISLTGRVSQHESTSLATSTATPAGSRYSDFDEGDGKKRRSSTRTSGIQVVPVDRTDDDDDDDDDDFNEFHQYLKAMTRKVRNKLTLANLMDDGLKRLETEHFSLTGDDVPKCRFEKSPKHAYQGPCHRPDTRCYAMVCNAYANAGLGGRGAQLAEQTAQRYELRTGEPSNASVLKGVMKAWIRVGDMAKAEAYLHQIEELCAITNDPRNCPDIGTYALFLEGLTTCTGKYQKRAGKLSVEILDRIRNSYLSCENTSSMPNKYIYEAVMKCQEVAYRGRGVAAFENIEKVFRQQRQDFLDFGEPPTMKPTAEAALPVFVAATRCYGAIEAIRLTEDLLEALQEKYEETGDADYFPIERMYTLLLSSYSKVNTEHAPMCAKKVDLVFQAMRDNGIAPNKFTMTAAISAKANDKEPNSIQEGEDLMRSMDNPDAVVYQTMIKAYCRNQHPEKADELMKELDSIWGCDVLTMGRVLDAWTKTRNPMKQDLATEKSEELLDEIIRRYQMGLVNFNEKHVDTWVFEDVARLWSSRRLPESGDRIVGLLEKMDELHQEVPTFFKPTGNFYVLAFDAYSTSGLSNAGSKAVALLERMRVLEGNISEPNIRILSSVLGSVTRSTGRGTVRRASEIFEEILDRFQQGDRTATVNTRTLTALLSTILKTTEKRAVKQTMDVLQKTIDIGKNFPSHIAPNTIVFNCVIDGLARRKVSDEAWELFEEMKVLASNNGFDSRPDATTYSCIVRAVTSRKTLQSVERLDSLVSEIFEKYEERTLEPDIQLFNTILCGYSRMVGVSRSAAEKATQLLLRLERLSGDGDSSLAPDILTYRSVCQALAWSKTQESAVIGKEIYLRAKSLASEDKISRLDRGVYSAGISSYTRSKETGALEMAEAILEEMEEQRRRGNKKATPDTRVYNYMLSAYASSHERNKAKRATELFERMKTAHLQGDQYCAPDVNSFNWLILAAARSHSDEPHMIRHNFDVALKNFRSVHSAEEPSEPNSLTYEFFIRACIKLLPPGNVQTSLVEKAFRLCRERGLVTPQVFKQAQCLIPELLSALERVRIASFSNEGESRLLELMPESWCSSIAEKYRNRRVAVANYDTTSATVEESL